MKALLLCAGFGTGLKPYTEKIPKPALPILNVPLAFYSWHLLKESGVDQFVVNTHHLPEQIHNLFSGRVVSKVIDSQSIRFSDEKPEILDTGGGIRGAQSLLTGEQFFIVANTDAIRNCDLREAIEFHKKSKAFATLVAMPHPGVGTQYGGLWTDENFDVHGFGKNFVPPTSGPKLDAYHYTGVQIVDSRIYKYLPSGPSPLFDTYRKALEGGEKVKAFVQSSLWLDAGTPEEFFNATSEMLKVLKNLKKEPLFEKLFKRFWPNFDKRPSLFEGAGCDHSLNLNGGNILLGNNVQLESDLDVKGFFVAGDNVEIAHGCEIENSVIIGNAKIPPNQKIKNQIIF